MSAIVVPIDDTEVKSTLRGYKQPICLFGEGPFDRRARLSAFLLQGDIKVFKSNNESVQEVHSAKAFLSQGSKLLESCRHYLTAVSLKRSQLRLLGAKEALGNGEATIENLTLKESKLREDIQNVEHDKSILADTRPISSVHFFKEEKAVLAGSWSGGISCWNLSNREDLSSISFEGHHERVLDLTSIPSSNVFASSCSDSSVYLWNIDKKSSTGQFVGHEKRVNCLTTHPTGRFLVSGSHDTTWRFWDVETQSELLVQEGHSKPIYSVSVHCDGSLLASTGGDSTVLLWDLRTGRKIAQLQGHINSILSCDWHPNGFYLASGGEDQSLRIWDIRKKLCCYSIPAHRNLVSSVKFDTFGRYLYSTGYDSTIKVWSAHDWSLIKELTCSSQKILSLAVSESYSPCIISGCFDKSFKIWKAVDVF
eukprot:TRINITY_DN501_c0_g1_i1.p1 TRINITY_DN501_c0_g1~~TRINITY_DN501_c0_g1_i1.p1  ORF type:complete len:423 (-),score=12.43 TRINITY_DN501_c0_g1_i1:30-1298(-)